MVVFPARWAQQPHYFALINFQVQIIDNFSATIRLAEVDGLEFQHILVISRPDEVLQSASLHPNPQQCYHRQK